MLENFLRQENEIAFTKRIKQKTPLTKPERNKLMRHVGEFTRRRYGFKPSKSQKVAVARALIELAPSLKSAEPDRPNFVRFIKVLKYSRNSLSMSSQLTLIYF